MEGLSLSSKKITLIIVKLLVVCICIQHMVLNYMFGGKAGLSYSKEILVFLLLLVLLPKIGAKVRIDAFQFMAFMGFIFCLFISSILFSNMNAFVYSARKYILPVLVCFLLHITSFFSDRKCRNSVYKFVIDFFVVLSIWGIFQILVLKDTFLMNLGYDTIFGHLDYTFYFNNFYFLQRNASTFASPNIFACLLSIVILALMMIGDELYKKKRDINIRMIILVSSLLLTFSRGSIISLFIVYFLFFLKKRKISTGRFKYIIGAIIIGVMAICVVNSVMNINIIETVFDWIARTLSGSESSSAGRSFIWKLAFDELLNNPWGIGAGTAGINANSLLTEQFACENSYLVMGLESGVLGLVCYLIFINSFTLRTKENKHIIKVILSFIMINFMFSNHIQDVEVMMILYLFVEGLYSNRKVVDTRKNECIKNV